MKTVLATILALAISQVTLAQTKKMSPPKNLTTTSVVPAATYTESTSSPNEITGYFGMVGGAINLGATFVKPKADYGFGGYLFMQTSKDKNNTPIVSGVTAFGALLKVNVVDNRSVRAYVAPGFGIAMIKEGSISGIGSKSDENLISPTFKMGVQYKTSPKFIIGLERMQFSNFLNDSLNNYAGPAEYYSVAGTFEF